MGLIHITLGHASSRRLELTLKHTTGFKLMKLYPFHCPACAIAKSHAKGLSHSRWSTTNVITTRVPPLHTESQLAHVKQACAEALRALDVQIEKYLPDEEVHLLTDREAEAVLHLKTEHAAISQVLLDLASIPQHTSPPLHSSKRPCSTAGQVDLPNTPPLPIGSSCPTYGAPVQLDLPGDGPTQPIGPQMSQSQCHMMATPHYDINDVDSADGDTDTEPSNCEMGLPMDVQPNETWVANLPLAAVRQPAPVKSQRFVDTKPFSHMFCDNKKYPSAVRGGNRIIFAMVDYHSGAIFAVDVPAGRHPIGF